VVGNIEVGTTAARTPDQPALERLARDDAPPKLRLAAPNTVRIKRSGNCGAMSQQGGDSGNYSMPQKLVQLVGCRDPKAGAGPWVRPAPAEPTKKS
jgi:hypothetical protein